MMMTLFILIKRLYFFHCVWTQSVFLLGILCAIPYQRSAQSVAIYQAPWKQVPLCHRQTGGTATRTLTRKGCWDPLRFKDVHKLTVEPLSEATRLQTSSVTSLASREASLDTRFINNFLDFWTQAQKPWYHLSVTTDLCFCYFWIIKGLSSG